eukprot:TRINITY_DN8787_c0_g1_i2.p2 TRINITY_DN8787_c0_g1~~TRINITY_DN8787_c0_g1_i2.p2  ORF type:complete len:115 (-),score=32.40 TRINITY_DN8787_c0_g1_i2:209-553(-)
MADEGRIIECCITLNQADATSEELISAMLELNGQLQEFGEPAVVLIEQQGGLEAFDMLQQHEDEGVASLAFQILQEHFADFDEPEIPDDAQFHEQPEPFEEDPDFDDQFQHNQR